MLEFSYRINSDTVFINYMKEKSMSYEIDYTGMPNGQTQAIKDCIEWLGKEQFAKVVEILILDEGRSPRHMVRIGLMMQGIQGYPAEVMMDKFWAV